MFAVVLAAGMAVEPIPEEVADLLPPLVVMQEARCFAYEYREYLQTLYTIHRDVRIWRAIQEAELLSDVYWRACCARSTYGEVRQYHLTCLERLIGEENLMVGKLPPPVPVWYFQETKR